MNACLTTTGLMRQFHRLFGVLVFSLFTHQVMAIAPPVVVSVDHRVTATFTKPQFDARKGEYTTQVFIKNRSAASLLSPLRLALDQFDGKNIQLLSAQGGGKVGQYYIEFSLPNGLLAADGVTEPAKVVFAVDKGKDIGAVKERVSIKSQSSFDFAYHVSAGVELAPLAPRAEPYALSVDSGKVSVRFNVSLVGKAKSTAMVYLRRSNDKSGIAMNDEGKSGDLVAKDGVFGASITVDASKLKPDTCLNYEAFINSGHAVVVSPPFSLCVSAFPLGVVASDITKPALFPDGSIAVADEVLITAKKHTSASAIQKLASGINAKVVGSIPSLNLYQLKLPAAVSASNLIELVAKLRTRAEVETASVNAIGSYALPPSDPQFGSQDGLTRVRANDVWDIGATGGGVTVVVLDTGLELTNIDFDLGSTCQVGSNPAMVVCSDSDANRHGTQVASVFAAKTDNGWGIAGVAGSTTIAAGSALHSIQTNLGPSPSVAQVAAVFDAAAAYISGHGAASVVNASFVYPAGYVDWTPVCQSINSLVLNGLTRRAVVINAAGNNGLNAQLYPARCNDLNGGLSTEGRNLFITVANSVSAPTSDCLVGGNGAQNSADTLCSGNTSTGIGGSNYGAWVDIAAPGAAIRTITSGANNYASSTGTSVAAPFVAGAAAILISCRDPLSTLDTILSQIETILKTSGSNVHVYYPPGVTPVPSTPWLPRLDIYRALSSVNHAPTGLTFTPTIVDENSNTPLGVEAGTLSATDPDTCDKLTFSIVGGADAGSFDISGNKLRFKSGVSLDSEVQQSYHVTVRVTDFFDLSPPPLLDLALQVDLHNLNDNSPIITSNGGGATASISIPENTTAVTTVTATDADNLGPLTYTISGTDAARFTINSATGVLSFIVPPDHEVPTDSGADSIYNVTVQVTDGTNTDSQAITVTVTNASEAPTGVPIVDPDPATIVNRTVNKVLTANTGPVYNPDSWTISSYQWKRSGSDIPGETAITHTLNSDDVGLFMSFSVTYTDGVLPPATLYSGTDAIAVGDPHITTVDGLQYDFQGEGEFVALRGANGMEIQLRMAAVSTAPPLPDDYTGLTSGVSVNTAVAARVGKYRVTYQPDTSANAAVGTFVLRVEGKPVTPPADGIDLGDGGRVLPLSGGGIQIDFPDQTTLMVNTSPYSFYGAHWLHINVFHTSAYEGLMGARSKGSWLPRLSDGSALGPKPAALHDRYEELYGKFADSWRVNKETTLFDYDKDTSTATYTNKAWPTENGPYAVGNGPVAKPLELKAAQLACKDVLGKNENANCVFDVRVMGQADLAKGHLLHQRIRLGATNIIVRGADKLNERGEMVITATVARHATVLPLARNIRALPTGTVQLMLGDKPLGKSVKLDERGQAKLVVTRQDLERFKDGKQAITARYLPTKGKDDVFLPSISKQLTRELKPAVVEGRVKK